MAVKFCLPIFTRVSASSRDYHEAAVDDLNSTDDATGLQPRRAFRPSVILDMRSTTSATTSSDFGFRTWVSVTDRAHNARDGQRALDDLARRNDHNLDGTPIIKTTSDIGSLFSSGCIT